MSTSSKSPIPSWLVQEPEGHGAPKTPGHWKTMWASDCARLEEAHHRGDEHVLVYGRKYVVDMKERTVRALYWTEEPAVKPVIRATYFLHKGHGWLPYCEEDAKLLEDTYASAKVQLRSSTCTEVEVPLTDGEHKAVMTRKEPGEPKDDYFADFDIDIRQKLLKPWSLLATTFYVHAIEVHRGSPEPAGWGGVLATEGDLPLEGEPPKHLVFVVHGIGESLWSRSSSVLASLREGMGPMRTMSADVLEDQRQTLEREKAAAGNAAGTADGTAAGDADSADKDETPKGELKECLEKGDACADTGQDTKDSAVGCDQGKHAPNVREVERGLRKQEREAGEEGARYVEFLPVEWFEQVHGADAASEEIMRNITLPSILGFRDFANQAIMDVMYYLTPNVQAAVLAVVGNAMNDMWETFSRFTKGFTGKVSVVGHSLGSIIAHDLLMAQPLKGGTQLAEGAISKDVPILSFYPEVLLACGSPIGAFLALRQSTVDNKNLFKFNTTRRFFNLFHLYDPVAYRLEPLLDRRLRDMPPEHVPHRGGDRIHVSVKKFNRGVNEVIDRMTRKTGASWLAIQSSINTTIKSAIGDPGGMKEDASVAREEVTDARDVLTERIDWVIQESTLEGMHPWASAVFAHSSYFTNYDMVMFLVNRLNEGMEEGEEEGRGGVREGENDGREEPGAERQSALEEISDEDKLRK